MPEVVSQQDIDALLKSGGQEPSKPKEENEIQPYDFRLPNRISKTQLRTIRTIHENFAESFSSFLVTKLQTIVNMSVNTVDQIYYSEYVMSVPDPACLFTFSIKHTDIKGILELNVDLALALVDRLLGGNGTSTKQQKIITPIEQKVLQTVVEKVMLDMKKAWHIIDNFDFVAERFEPDVDFVQLTSPNESVLLITFEVILGEKSYFMNICFATFAFDPIIAKLSSKKLSSVRPTKYNGMSAQELIRKQLNSVLLPVTVELGKSTITLQEMLDLKKGDMIILDKKIHEELTVKVNGKTFYYGYPGIVNNHKAVKVTKNLLTDNSF
ncbi:flagellar motor switch protein FliM [Ignavibacterium sp.]|uniref:flagellar motor switch protein FliM n=1 Tax=Ignavibacterium sp. TaxID=2651167 RepID=UPI00220E84AF|nr:flagellar motor switch protein FliM [Ignavibacterium sp.]BDQ02851.1 MAG: flagellar motor switch protein FliM [Ignavibacterium sp.]